MRIGQTEKTDFFPLVVSLLQAFTEYGQFWTRLD